MASPRLWPDWNNPFLQCFFVRLRSEASREDFFEQVARKLSSSRWRGWGRFFLRLPRQGPWLVADWEGVGELPMHAAKALSGDLGVEVIGLMRTRAHGSATSSFQLFHFAGGKEQPLHTVHMGPDGVTPVAGDKNRLPSFVDLEKLPLVSKTLQLPGGEGSPFDGAEPIRTIRFIPIKGLGIFGGS